MARKAPAPDHRASPRGWPVGATTAALPTVPGLVAYRSVCLCPCSCWVETNAVRISWAGHRMTPKGTPYKGMMMLGRYLSPAHEPSISRHVRNDKRGDRKGVRHSTLGRSALYKVLSQVIQQSQIPNEHSVMVKNDLPIDDAPFPRVPGVISITLEQVEDTVQFDVQCARIELGCEALLSFPIRELVPEVSEALGNADAGSVQVSDEGRPRPCVGDCLSKRACELQESGLGRDPNHHGTRQIALAEIRVDRLTNVVANDFTRFRHFGDQSFEVPVGIVWTSLLVLNRCLARGSFSK